MTDRLSEQGVNPATGLVVGATLPPDVLVIVQEMEQIAGAISRRLEVQAEEIARLKRENINLRAQVARGARRA